MKVVVDEDKCVAAGQCVAAAADVFDGPSAGPSPS
ncbi:ferredoxin [Streptomyces sp. NPDC059568]